MAGGPVTQVVHGVVEVQFQFQFWICSVSKVRMFVQTFLKDLTESAAITFSGDWFRHRLQFEKFLPTSSADLLFISLFAVFTTHDKNRGYWMLDIGHLVYKSVW